MKVLTASKYLLIFVLPFLIILFALNFLGFDDLFYKESFSKYGLEQNITQAILLHENVINFVKGKSSVLTNDFTEKEKQHLWDVKKLVRISTILLYILIVLFLLLLIASICALKISNFVMNFIGKVLVFGGILTVIFSLLLLAFISLDFSKTFDSFHRLFFKKGTYVFDPTKEIIVNIYPEQLFMDLGIKISKWVFIVSVIVIIIGFFLLFKSKQKEKNKKYNQNRKTK